MYEEENENTGLFPEPPKHPVQQAKKKKGRRAYLDDIHRTADGKYVYTGQCYEYDGAINTRGSVLLRLWLLMLPALAACVGSGLFTTPFMRDTWYTIGPFGFEFVFVGTVVWAVGRITANGSILREYVRKQTFGALPARCWLAVGFAGVGIIGGVVFMLVHGTGVTLQSGEVVDQTFRCVAYLCLKAAVIVSCALLARYAPKVAWKETAEKV